MDADNLALAAAAGLVSPSYVAQGAAALAARRRAVKALLSNRRLPEEGWDDATIEMLLQDAALMDSNTFPGQVGVGEREGRVASPLVARRLRGGVGCSYALAAHGVGRSGDLTAEQPKAAGASLLAKLCALLAGDALRVAGLEGFAPPVVLPCATGMALTLTLLAAAGAPRELRRFGGGGGGGGGLQGTTTTSTAPAGNHTAAAAAAAAAGNDTPPPFPLPPLPPPPLLPRYVVWSRIDQRTCLKAITAANLVPVVVELQRRGDELTTDVAAMRAAVERHGGADGVAAVVTTTSCFAPRASDDVVAVARLCAELGVPHVINNAYGVQAAALTRAVTRASRVGRVDAVVQSTDKNFMVPVGGALLAGPLAAAAPAAAAGAKGGGGGGAGAGAGAGGGAGAAAAAKAAAAKGGAGASAAGAATGGRAWLSDAVARGYPGRAGAAPMLDLLVTLLSWGAAGWRARLAAREALHAHMRRALGAAAALLGERLLDTPNNPISLAVTLDRLAGLAAAAAAAATAGAGPGTSQQGAGGGGGGGSSSVTFLGAMLWARNVSGARVLAPPPPPPPPPPPRAAGGGGGGAAGDQQEAAAATTATTTTTTTSTTVVAGIPFAEYGRHAAGYPHAYVTAAAAIGGSEAEADAFAARLVAAYRELEAKLLKQQQRGQQQQQRGGAQQEEGLRGGGGDDDERPGASERVEEKRNDGDGEP